jgi:uncharacterized membrane protein YhaH (DUF805 family)
MIEEEDGRHIERPERNWLFGLDGRANRRTYFIQELMGGGAAIVGYVVVFTSGSTVALVVFWALFLTGFAVHICASVRRLHDTGMFGWAVLAFWIPVIGQLFWGFMFLVPGNSRPNKHGIVPVEFLLG